MASVSQLLEKLKGSKPTDEEIKRVYHIASALGVPDNDVFLALIVALDQYWGLYSNIPDKITAASSEAAKKAAETAKTEIARLSADQQKMLAEAVYKTSEKAAQAASTKTMVKWIASALVLCSLSVGCLGYFAYRQGVEVGKDQGYVSARNEELLLKERDAFQKSELYALAVAYDKAGLLSDILNCRWRGWSVKDGKCIPEAFAIEGKYYSAPWQIPGVSD